MERVFKVTTKSNPDPSGLYPSERRYSASIVVGLSIVFFIFSVCAILMGSLIIHKIYVTQNQSSSIIVNITTSTEINLNLNFDDDVNKEIKNLPVVVSTTTPDHSLLDKNMDAHFATSHTMHYYIDAPALISAGCFLMAFGCFLSSVAGLLAWKRWYIDHNITFFFLFSTFSILTSAICLMLSLLTISNMRFDNFDSDTGEEAIAKGDLSPLTMSLAMNIIVLSLTTFVWSVMSSRVGYRGMRNTYPDDMMVSKGGGKVEVNIVRKGSANCNLGGLPPQILNNVKNVGKIAKYLPKKENSSTNNLPKEESNAEYQQRVNKFLSAEPESVTATENKV